MLGLGQGDGRAAGVYRLACTARHPAIHGAAVALDASLLASKSQVGVHLRDLTSDSAAYGLWGLATTPKAMAGALVEMTRKRFQAMTGGDLSSEEEAEEAGGLPERQHVEGSLDVLLSMGTLPEGASQWPRRFTLGGRGRRPPLAAPSRLPAISNAEFQVGYKREASGGRSASVGTLPVLVVALLCGAGAVILSRVACRSGRRPEAAGSGDGGAGAGDARERSRADCGYRGHPLATRLGGREW